MIMNNYIASVWVDCQKWFWDNKVNELYVQDWEQIVAEVNRVMYETKKDGWINIASKDWHKKWNISFASNFKGKVSITSFWVNEVPDARAFLTYDEVKNWTEDNHGMWPNVTFTVEQLKAKLLTLPNRTQIMWPDHCVAKTSWAEFITWIDDSLIDRVVYKWDDDIEHPYSAFPGIEITTKKSISEILDENKVEVIKVTWLATDYCVCDTAIDLANTNKYEVQLILNATRAVADKTKKEALEKMRAAGVIIK